MNISFDLYNISFIVLLAVSAWLAWRISVADWRRRIIPDAYLFPLLLIGLIIIAFFPWFSNIGDSAIAAICGYALAAIIGYLFDITKTKNHKHSVVAPIGMGDIKLISVGGIWLGTFGLALALVIACVSGMVWGYIKRQKYIPLAPFFIGGGILSLIIIAFLL